MTREEAIKELKIQFLGEYDRQREAKNMAIEALEQEPYGDCISRAEAKRIVDFYTEQIDGIFRVNESIDNLPSVQPKPKIDILDKIRAEIFNACSDNYHMPVYKLSCEEIFEIIDKYKTESED